MSAYSHSSYEVGASAVQSWVAWGWRLVVLIPHSVMADQEGHGWPGGYMCVHEERAVRPRLNLHHACGDSCLVSAAGVVQALS